MPRYTCSGCGESFHLEARVEGLGGGPKDLVCPSCEAAWAEYLETARNASSFDSTTGKVKRRGLKE